MISGRRSNSNCLVDIEILAYAIYCPGAVRQYELLHAHLAPLMTQLPPRYSPTLSERGRHTVVIEFPHLKLREVDVFIITFSSGSSASFNTSTHVVRSKLNYS